MIRKIKQDDVPVLENMLKKIQQFTEEEVEVAMELIHIAANNPLQTDYHLFVYDDEENGVLGYHCTGKRPLTEGTYDLYWIAADPDAVVKGIGASLLNHAEEFVKRNNGTWMLAETSSKDNYSGTRNFYLRNNYSVIAQIRDFYRKDDDLVVFGKFFN